MVRLEQHAGETIMKTTIRDTSEILINSLILSGNCSGAEAVARIYTPDRIGRIRAYYEIRTKRLFLTDNRPYMRKGLCCTWCARLLEPDDWELDGWPMCDVCIKRIGREVDV